MIIGLYKGQPILYKGLIHDPTFGTIKMCSFSIPFFIKSHGQSSGRKCYEYMNNDYTRCPKKIASILKSYNFLFLKIKKLVNL